MLIMFANKGSRKSMLCLVICAWSWKKADQIKKIKRGKGNKNIAKICD